METKTRHVLSISGGKDSAALAIYLMQTRHIPDMEYVFMDTGKELPETYVFLSKLEGYLGKPITKLTSDRTFDDYLRLHGNFLPSAGERWCTIMLKVKPFERYVGNGKVYSYIGIRADEDRQGFKISPNSNIIPVYPFKEDGIAKQDVQDILNDSGLGLPEYYKWRSRSGCFFCFFQQKVEWLGLKENHPDLFAQAKTYEIINDDMGIAYTWNEEGTLDKITKNPEEIRANHFKAMQILAKTKRRSPRLIDVMRAADPFEDADNFDQILQEQADSEGCLICTL